jgi:hypothetical protein
VDSLSKKILIASIVEVEQAIDDQVKQNQFNTAEALYWLNQERVKKLNEHNNTRPGDTGTQPPQDGK